MTLSSASSTQALPLATRGMFLLMVVAMIATPLFAQGGDQRRVLANVVVLSLFGVGVLTTWAAHRLRAIAAAGAVIAATYFVELLGSTTGFPFGEYDYTGALTPQLAGIPVVVLFAWAGITLVVHGVFAGRLRRVWLQLPMMAAAITAWDVFLDPQMVGEGYWQWKTASVAFRGIPIVNYVGWFVTALLNSALVVGLCRPRREAASRFALTTYATLAALSTVGFVFFFDDVVVALVGAVTMGACVWCGYNLSRHTQSSAA